MHWVRLSPLRLDLSQLRDVIDRYKDAAAVTIACEPRKLCAVFFKLHCPKIGGERG
jgi:hypothetical protein